MHEVGRNLSTQTTIIWPQSFQMHEKMETLGGGGLEESIVTLSDPGRISFGWYDVAYRKKVSLPNASYEYASVMFNAAGVPDPSFASSGASITRIELGSPCFFGPMRDEGGGGVN